MCPIVLWAIPASSYDARLEAMTAASLGVAPQRTDLRIVSSRVAAGAATFTLTRSMCDCDGLVGLGAAELRAEETSAEALLGWLRALRAHDARLSRVAVLRSWSPDGPAVRPQRARGVSIAEVDESVLRGVADEMLLTIDL